MRYGAGSPTASTSSSTTEPGARSRVGKVIIIYIQLHKSNPKGGYQDFLPLLKKHYCFF